MTKKSTKKSEGPTLFPYNFNIGQLNHCCGIGEVGGFKEGNGARRTWDYWGETQAVEKPKFFTKKEQIDDLYDRILKESWPDEENTGDDRFSCLLITLVSCYAAVEGDNNIDGIEAGSAQLPELEEKLIEEGWNIVQVFINPNHGNEVTVYMKYFPERDTVPDDY